MKLYDIADTFDSVNGENAKSGDLLIYCYHLPNYHYRMIYQFENYYIKTSLKITTLCTVGSIDEITSLKEYYVIYKYNDFFKIIPEEYVQYLKKLLVFS